MQTSLADTQDFLQLLDHLPDELHSMFADNRSIVVARAPGRLDLMGGIADYSGSLVLQLPIADATHAAVQLRDDDIVHLVSLNRDESGHREFTFSLANFGTTANPLAYETAREMFASTSDQHWAAYVAGVFLVLMRERGVAFKSGANILIRSDVPEGKGVSSSAALEVSVMRAVAAAYEIDIEPRELAFLCQKVENHVAGAPCGLMDQMTSACGTADQLLALLCQPGELLAPVKLPDELAVWGIDSGIRHAVSGADYGTVRTAAFMGYRIIADLAGLPCHSINDGQVTIEDKRWRGYLANLSPTEFNENYAAHLPHAMTGDEFLARYQGITDSVTRVVPDRNYPVFQATQHPINENARVNRFAEILQTWRGEAEALGELMYASHVSYSACGLGSDGTDELVELVRTAGPSAGLFGAKITGGGSGGTVAVLAQRGADNALQEVVKTYSGGTGRNSLIISGSSPGAVGFDPIVVTRGKR